MINTVSGAVVKIGIQHFDQLLPLLRKPEVAHAAATALGWIGNRQAVPALVRALKNTDVTLSTSAAEALGKLGDYDSVEALINALSRERGVAVAAHKALQHITGHLDLDRSQQPEWRLWWKENRPA